ncbi:MAG: GNAT family N-acetyltransferase [Candidatus Cloacimonetes bacterium]|nr:GNAT family N-acetyltransferase [Candidatus Cloacimonadota bacterium]
MLLADTFFLRPWQKNDARWYVESRDEEVFKWTNERRGLTVEEAEHCIMEANSDPGVICFAIVAKNNMELLGNIALTFQDHDRRIAEIMYWLSPGGRRRGMATGSVKLLCQWAFDTLGVQKINLKVHKDNIPSQLVAKGAGFQERTTYANSIDENYVWFTLTCI